MLYTLRFFSLQNAVCFIMLTCLVPVLFTFIHILYTGCAKIKKDNSGAKGLINFVLFQRLQIVIQNFKTLG